MNLGEDRWFVRFRGHTLGPLTTDQIMTSLRNQELSNSDKIASSKNPAWSAISAHPSFAPFTKQSRGGIESLAPIPSPHEVWQRKARQRAAALSPSVPAATFKAPVFSRVSSDEAPRKPKRVAAPGKKLGRPRKNPGAAHGQAAAASFTTVELSLAELVAPVLAAAPASVTTAPMPPANLAPAPLPEKAAVLSASLPARPDFSEPSAAAQLPEAEEIAMAPSPALSPAPAPALEELLVPAEPINQPAMAEEAPAPAPLAIETMAAAPVAQAAPKPFLAEESLAVESLSLLESLRDWRRKEEELEKTMRARVPSAPAPVPATLEEAARPSETADPKSSPAASARRHLAENKQFLLIAAVLALLVAAAVFITVNKTRGSGNLSFPNPSGPTKPDEKADPTPSLRAPTRPQRD